MGKRKSSNSSKTDAEGAKIPPEVLKAYEKYKDDDRQVLLELRHLVIKTARDDNRIGKLTETLKWGEPAFLTDETKAGSTLRLGYSKLSNSPALFVSCSTPLLMTLKELDTAGVLQYHGLRDIAVPNITSKNTGMIQTCILKTLTYHLDKKKTSNKKRNKVTA